MLPLAGRIGRARAAAGRRAAAVAAGSAATVPDVGRRGPAPLHRLDGALRDARRAADRMRPPPADGPLLQHHRQLFDVRLG